MAKPSWPTGEPLGLLAAAVRRGVGQLVTARIGALGLSVQQFWLLVGIAEHPCHSQAALAARLRIDEATTCRVIRTLAARRWVRTARDAGDRRRVQLQLTPEGERLARTLLPIARQVRTAVESTLSPSEIAATRAALMKILTAVEKLAATESPAPRRRERRPPERAHP